jgi:hypothetical protein
MLAQSDSIKRRALYFHLKNVLSGFHRYVFLLFKQTKRLDDIEECANRGNFDLAGFVAKSELNQFLAANFYEAKHEPLE